MIQSQKTNNFQTLLARGKNMTTQKRYSLKNFDFKENESKHFGFAFIKKLENPCIIENNLVVGYRTQKIRSNNTGCTLSNHVHSLLFRKIGENGKMSNWLYQLDLNDFSAEFTKRFWQVFKASSDYFLYDQIQLSIAKDILDQYDTHAPDSVSYYMNNNNYYWDLLYKLKADRENRRIDARQQILAMQEKWYRDENLSSIFDVAMSKPLPRDSGVSEIKKEIEAKEREIRKIDKYLLNASRIEATWIERDEKRKIEKELASLYSQLK